jgi:hypothetical protein
MPEPAMACRSGIVGMAMKNENLMHVGATA